MNDGLWIVSMTGLVVCGWLGARLLIYAAKQWREGYREGREG